MTPDSPSNTDTQTQASTWLKPSQVHDLRSAAHSDRFERYLRDRNEVIVALLYDTGLRVAELVALDVDLLELDDETPHLVLPGDIQKQYPTENTAPRTVRMELARDRDTADTVTRLKSYLSNRWRDSPALFPSRQSDRMTTESVRNVVRALATEAGIRPQTNEGTGEPSDVTPHTLRHSVAYRMLHVESGYTMYDARNRLRHRSILTTERVYDHFEMV